MCGEDVQGFPLIFLLPGNVGFSLGVDISLQCLRLSQKDNNSAGISSCAS